MNLLVKGNYLMYQFSKDHINALIFSVVLGILIIFSTIFIKRKKMLSYFKFLGFLLLILKIIETLYRIYIEKYPLYDNLPLHLCNITTFLCILYLFSKKNLYYNILYYWFLTYFIVLIIPGTFEYSTKLYSYIFIFFHFIPLIVILLARIHFNEKTNKFGLNISIFLFLIIYILLIFLNPILKTNFMYNNGYILESLNIIKPFMLYQILLALVIVISMYVMKFIAKIFNL